MTLIAKDPVKALRASLLAKRASEITLDDLTDAVELPPDVWAEAVAEADDVLARNEFPTYSELLAALRYVKEFEQHPGGSHLPRGSWFALHEKLDALLARAGGVK